ncbi:MAG: twin-arginine translocation signal domain-containing protein, partial [Anaerolineae bacterium]
MKTSSTFPTIPSSEITPRHLYLSRRDFLKAMGVVGGGTLLAACGLVPDKTAPQETDQAPGVTGSDEKHDERGDPANSYQDITHYNNYYEFTTDKQGVARLAENFKTSP